MISTARATSAIVQGVSYPNPNLSHFTSMAIWQSASLSGVPTGWIGRWLDTQPHDAFNAIGVGSTLPPAFVGEKSVASMVDVTGIQLPWGPATSLLPRLGRSSSSDDLLEAAAATSIADLYSTASLLGPLIPTSPTGAMLSQQLSLVATLINANVPTRVWEVNLSSFDTHTGEQGDQNALLAEVDAAIGSFMTSISAGSSLQGRDDHDLLGVRSSRGFKRQRGYGSRDVGAGDDHWQWGEGRSLWRAGAT